MRVRRFEIGAFLVVVGLMGGCFGEDAGVGADGREHSSQVAQGADDGERAILDAFDRRLSKQTVQAEGVVERILEDDLKGSRHQRFIVKLSSGHTLLLVHNIDLAPRVPLDEGDTIRFRGQYEYNDRGGVVHWTHHDPQRRRPGGWLQHQGRVYR